MILTQCPCCAAPLPPTSAKQCSRCKTRYCGVACQKKHWEEGGHDKLCRKIRKGGGAEQYNANKKYTEAVAVAAEECAEDTKGQTCYICTQALHWKTKEGLVRMCACRGTAGFAHVSCLAEQAKILVAEAEENNLSEKTKTKRWERWDMCGLCEQNHHSVVRCALGWACWKAYVGQTEGHWTRRSAMTTLANGLHDVGKHDERLRIHEAELAYEQRTGVPENDVLTTLGNIAGCYTALGRHKESLALGRKVYDRKCALSHAFPHAFRPESIFITAFGLANQMCGLGLFDECKEFAQKRIPEAERALGPEHGLTLCLRSSHAAALLNSSDATLDDMRLAVKMMEDVAQTMRRVLGKSNPRTLESEQMLANARMKLAAEEARTGLAAL